jgi:hypothetical protein
LRADGNSESGADAQRRNACGDSVGFSDQSIGRRDR